MHLTFSPPDKTSDILCTSSPENSILPRKPLMYWTLADATSLEIKEFLIKEDCGPTIIGVCDSEIVGQDFIDALVNGNAVNVDELLAELSIEKDWLKKIGFPSSEDGPPSYNLCAARVECILNKYLTTAFCNKSFKVFEKLNANGYFGLEIEYDWSGKSEQHPFVNLGYVNEGGNMKDQHVDPCCWSDPDDPYNYDYSCCWKPALGAIPNGWDGLDGNMADTYPVRPLGGRSTINKFICDTKNALEIASVISHEVLHSKIMAHMYDLCETHPNCNPNNFGTFSVKGTVWPMLLDFYAEDGITQQHELMDAVFKDDLIAVLMEMNGDTDFSKANKERYHYFVMTNIAPDGTLISEGFIENQAELERLKALSETLYFESDGLDSNGMPIFILDINDKRIPKLNPLDSGCP